MPLVGDFLVTPTYGSWLDRVAAVAIRWGTDSPVNHAAVFVGTVNGYDKPQIVEARPHGAGLADWDSYPDCTWSTGRLPEHLTPTNTQRVLIAEAALDLMGTPYGWLDLVAITLAQKRLHSVVDVHKALREQPWWVRRIVSTKTLICSELVDTAWLRGGIHLFDDDRLPGLVSPADLLDLLQ